MKGTSAIMQTMKSRASWKNSNCLLLLCTLLLAPASIPAFATGGGDECDDLECSSFFAPEVIQSPTESPFFRSYHTFYHHGYDVSSDEANNTAATNLDEWFRHFDGQLKRGTLSWMLYKMPLADLNNLVTVLNGKEAPLSNRARVLLRLLSAYGQKSKVISSLQYLEFAKKVEPIANRRSREGAWDPREQQKHLGEDTATARVLIESSDCLIKAAPPFVAQRLKLQVIRLQFYTAQYAAAQSYYEANRTSFSEGGSAKWRFLEAAAGAFYKDKKYGKANYIYSLVFGHFSPQKRSAYFSFHPVEQSDWNESLSLARSTREKEVLWQLLGIYADGMAAIDQIFALNPESDLLPLLLVREVNKAEENWSTNRQLDQFGDENNKPKPDREAVGVVRVSRLRAIADSGRVSKLYLWRLAVGHLFALAGETENADSYLHASAQGMPRDALLRGQARSSLLLNKVLSMKGVEHGSEEYLARTLSWLAGFQSKENFRAAYLNTWVLTKLSGIYLAAGDTTRGLMLNDQASHPVYRDINQINAIFEFRNNTRSAFDKFLVTRYDYKESELRRLQALTSLYHADFAGALAYLKLAGAKAQNSPLYANPFTGRIVDCHDCEIGNKPVMTLEQFTERMSELGTKANGTGPAAAQASLFLGNAFYNMSYYGNGRAVYNTAHSNLAPDRENKNGDAELALNMEQAERFYKRAAELSSDQELRAQATFLAAKTEQNRFYNSHVEGDPVDIHPGKYYLLLKEKFHETSYFKEIIRECGYFRTYMSH